MVEESKNILNKIIVCITIIFIDGIIFFITSIDINEKNKIINMIDKRKFKNIFKNESYNNY